MRSHAVSIVPEVGVEGLAAWDAHKWVKFLKAKKEALQESTTEARRMMYNIPYGWKVDRERLLATVMMELAANGPQDDASTSE